MRLLHVVRFSDWKLCQIMSTVQWSSLIGTAIALLYGICSASMAFANKAVLTSYGFNYPFFLVTCQMAISIVTLELLRLTGQTSLVSFSLSRGALFLVPSIFYAANCVFSLTALGGMNIPMYGLIKRCIPVAILFLGVSILRKPLPSKRICFAVAMITCGCIVAGLGDLTFDMRAYLYGLASVFSQALYLLLVQKHADDIGAAESLHLNSYNTLPMLLFCSVATGEFRSAVTQFAFTDIGFVVTFVLVIVFGCLLNYLLFLCTTYNSALTTSITGTLKSIVQTVIGMFTFGGIAINIFTISGIMLNFVGGGLYTYVKYRDSRHQSHDHHEPIAKSDNDKLNGIVENGHVTTNGYVTENSHLRKAPSSDDHCTLEVATENDANAKVTDNNISL